ncbi:MAG TPA: hypothetical protein VMI31_18075, partial [Fimbriimonadaceae bacterium]|nr:hypothetical protein [Fimbriimonadaceae bacterium]
LLTIVATSRIPLAVPGEQVIPVGPLESADEAAAMFLDRASLIAHLPDSGSDADVLVAHRIAKDLDGIPLAIEIAAAQAGVLSLPEIELKLEDRLSFLETRVEGLGSRHECLGSVLDWSIESLSEEARKVLGMLSLFYGTFTLESAAAVWGKPVVREIESLRRRALIIDSPGVELRRFRMLEPVREAARQRLDPAAASRYRAALRTYLVDFSDRYQPQLRSSETAARAVLVLAEEVENYRNVLASALEEDPELGLELAMRYATIGAQQGHILGARRWLETYLLGREWPPSRLLAAGFFELAIAVGFYGQDDLEIEYLHKAHGMAEESGAVSLQVVAGTNLALNYLWTNRFTPARAMAERTMANLSPQSPHRLACELVVARVRGLLGELDWARNRVQEIWDGQLRASGDWWIVSDAWCAVAQLALEAEDYEVALAAAREGLGTLEKGGHDSLASNLLSFLTRICLAAGRTDEVWELVSRMNALGVNRGVAAGSLFGRFYTGLLLSNGDLLAEAAQHAIELTQWIIAVRAIDAVALMTPELEVAQALAEASNEILADHGIELSTGEARRRSAALADRGITPAPAQASSGDRSRRWMKMMDDVLARAWWSGEAANS